VRSKGKVFTIYLCFGLSLWTKHKNKNKKLNLVWAGVALATLGHIQVAPDST